MDTKVRARGFSPPGKGLQPPRQGASAPCPGSKKDVHSQYECLKMKNGNI